MKGGTVSLSGLKDSTLLHNNVKDIQRPIKDTFSPKVLIGFQLLSIKR